MKLLSLAVLLAGPGGASSAVDRPVLSIKIRDGTFSDLFGTIDPGLKWSVSATAGAFDLRAGVGTSLGPGPAAVPPLSLWGSASRETGGWTVSARADGTLYDGTAPGPAAADVALRAARHGRGGPSVDVAASVSAAGGLSVTSVGGAAGISVLGTGAIVRPRYDVASRSVDLAVGYSILGAGAEIVASAGDRILKLTRNLGGIGDASASVALNSGEFSVEWERALGGGEDDDGISATVKGQRQNVERVDVVWKDAGWTANVGIPFSAAGILGEPSVSIGRDLKF